MFWAVSQATSMRRVNIEGGDLSLMDYCSNPAYASGGFIADSKAGKIISGSQQQFIARNSNIGQWDGALMGTCPKGFFSLNSSSSCLLKIVVFLIDKCDLVVEKVVVCQINTYLLFI